MERLKRGDLWTAAGCADYAGKLRPVVIVQDGQFDATDSVTVALCTSDPTDLPMFRVAIAPNAANGLREPTRVMADKISTMPRGKLGQRIGALGRRDLANVDQALRLFLGLAGG